MREGVFRYDLSDVVTRTVPGRYGIIAMVRTCTTLLGGRGILTRCVDDMLL